MRTRPLDWTALTLIILGAINWGLIGLFKFDLIATVCGGVETIIARIIYCVIALAGLYCLSLYGRVDTREFTVADHRLT
ncbi:MAG: DUF378 domain-containing protein [Clostridiales bacterium]|jgi:uncharacterized membrane protein YuzA (DUF378 family)|nr:DUF378 domain-containing protein [Clostridiales bacterium]